MRRHVERHVQTQARDTHASNGTHSQSSAHLLSVGREQAGDLEHVMRAVREMAREVHMVTAAHQAMSDAFMALVEANAVDAARQILEWRATAFGYECELAGTAVQLQSLSVQVCNS